MTTHTQIKVLIVDDSALSRQAAQLALEDAGFAVVTSDNPIATASLIIREAPDLLLLDYNMASIDGGKVARALRNSPACRDLPIILYSSSPAESLSEVLGSGTVDGFIPKAADAADLPVQLNYWLKSLANRNASQSAGAL